MSVYGCGCVCAVVRAHTYHILFLMGLYVVGGLCDACLAYYIVVCVSYMLVCTKVLNVLVFVRLLRARILYNETTERTTRACYVRIREENVSGFSYTQRRIFYMFFFAVKCITVVMSAFCVRQTLC